MATYTDEFVQKLIRAKRKMSQPTPFPGSDLEAGFNVAFFPLTERQLDDARMEAHQYIESRCKQRGLDVSSFVEIDPTAYDVEIQRQILAVGVVDPDSDTAAPKPFFQHVKQVRDLDGSVRQLLYQLWDEWDQRNYQRVTWDSAKVEELIEAIKKAPDEEVIWAQFAHGTLVTFVRSLIALRSTSTTPKSSTS